MSRLEIVDGPWHDDMPAWWFDEWAAHEDVPVTAVWMDYTEPLTFLAGYG